MTEWWGEGDEKIYVDGEDFPSHFGTGTEDYYGYAWCCPERFDSPFHAQPRCEGPGNFGNTTNARYRLLDGIPFTKRFQFDIEIWHWATTTVDYAVTTFWYGAAGAAIVDGVGPDRDEFEDEIAEPVAYKCPFSIQFRDFKFVGLSPNASGSASVQNMQGFTKNGFSWVEDKQIWWRDGKPGDQMTLEVTKVEPGKKTLVLGACCARDYGVAQFYWNGEKVGKPIDFFNTPDVIHRTVRLAIPETTTETGTLTVELVGRNEKSIGEMLGFDSIAFE